MQKISKLEHSIEAVVDSSNSTLSNLVGIDDEDSNQISYVNVCWFAPENFQLLLSDGTTRSYKLGILQRIFVTLEVNTHTVAH